MEARINRKALEEGIKRMVGKSDFRLLLLLYQLWRYILGEEDNT